MKNVLEGSVTQICRLRSIYNNGNCFLKRNLLVNANYNHYNTTYFPHFYPYFMMVLPYFPVSLGG